MTTAVDPNTLAQPEEDFWQDATPSISFKGEPPITVRGMVISQIRTQQTDFDNGDPLTWNDGRPRLKVVIELKCAIEDIPVNGDDEESVSGDDDGRRMLHVRIPSGAYTAIKQAIKDAGQKTLANGDVLTLTYARDGAQTKEDIRKKRTPPKEFDALLEPASEPPF